jgi:intein-encoded DNA endonuclease-like protein
MKRIYDVRDDFFDNWSHDMAYILGFITADGSISLDGGHRLVRVFAHKKDMEVLEYIRSCVCLTRPIESQKNRNVRELRWTSQHQCNVLGENFGIVSRKSLVVRCQFEIPEIYFGDYLRGLFDGDGSFVINRQWSKPRVHSILYSGSKNFLLDVRDKFGGNGSIHKKSDSNCYRWTLGFKDSILLREIMYYNHSGFSLSRKRNILFDYWKR